MAEDTVQHTPGFSEHDSGEVRLEHKAGRGWSFSETTAPCPPSPSQQSPVEMAGVLKQHSSANSHY